MRFDVLAPWRRNQEQQLEDNRGKVCLENGEKYVIEHTETLRVRDVCIEIAKRLGIAPVALDFFTLLTTDCEHCLEQNRQSRQECTKNDQYLNPKRLLCAEECSSKVFFFKLAFKAMSGPDIRILDKGAFAYFLMQCRRDYVNGRITGLTDEQHLTLLVLESIIRAHENNVTCKDVLKNPKRFGFIHMFEVKDKDFSVKDVKNHLLKEIKKFTKCQQNVEQAKNFFLLGLEKFADFGVTKIVVNKFYCNPNNEVYQTEWEILISAIGLRKKRTLELTEERNGIIDFDVVERGMPPAPGAMIDEIIHYKDIEYLEVEQSTMAEIIHISRRQGLPEVISTGSIGRRESLITLIEGFYRLVVNQYKTLTKYDPGLELAIPIIPSSRREIDIHGPVERRKVEIWLKAVYYTNEERSGVHMIRRSQQKFDSYDLSFFHESEVRHYEVVTSPTGRYGILNGPQFDSLAKMLEFYKTAQDGFPTTLTKYAPIPRQGLCAMFCQEITYFPSPPQRKNSGNQFKQTDGNVQHEKDNDTFTGDSEDKELNHVRMPDKAGNPSEASTGSVQKHLLAHEPKTTTRTNKESPSQWKWDRNTVIHRDKYQLLLDYAQKHPEKIKEINGVRVCCTKDFLIGTGCDGTRLYIGLAKDGCEKAVKRLPKDVCAHLGSQEKKILNTLNAVQSKYVVRYWFYDDETDEEYAYLIVDLCEQTLKQYVAERNKDDLTNECPVILRQIMDGLSDLQRNPEAVLHRDLKPSNIMRNVSGNWLLTDFGISRTLPEEQTTHRSEQKGTKFWRAVESYPPKDEPDSRKEDQGSERVRYKKKSDIQVAGMVAYYILTKGEHPFGREEERVLNLRNGNPIDLTKLPDAAANDLISWMIQHKPEDRPSAKEALKHPYLQPAEQQFELLNSMGNEQEIKMTNTICDLVRKVNSDPLLSFDWRAKITTNVMTYLCTNEIDKREVRYGCEWTQCLRLIRNTTQHWNDRPCPRPEAYYIVGNPQEYFLKLFPTLPVVIHRIVRSSDWKKRETLQKFFM